jgi:hypothetical protein
MTAVAGAAAGAAANDKLQDTTMTIRPSAFINFIIFL